MLVLAAQSTDQYKPARLVGRGINQKQCESVPTPGSSRRLSRLSKMLHLTTVGLHIACALQGTAPSLSPVKSHIHTFGGLEDDVAAEHRKLVLPALNPLVRLQDPYQCVCHLGQCEVLT